MNNKILVLITILIFTTLLGGCKVKEGVYGIYFRGGRILVK